MQNKIPPLSRRNFCKKSASLLASTVIATELSGDPEDKLLPLQLGFDNFSIRALGWKAPKLLDYARSQNLNTVLFSDLDVYETLDSSYLNEIKKEAENFGITIQTGTGGICPTSKKFKNNYGTATEHLNLIIRVAKNVGSTVARCYLGSMQDRKEKGGIRRHMESTLKVLNQCKKNAMDSGVCIAVENHAGDLHSRELVELIERAGTNFVGATLDSGNATWTLEHPVDALRNLAPYAVSSGIRDSMVWKSEKGVRVQWTAMGEGCVNLDKFFREWKSLCPSLPLQLEIISGFSKEFPYLEEKFWGPYSTISARDFSQFLTLSEKGKSIDPFRAPQGIDKLKAQQEFQLTELERSISFCRKKLLAKLQ